MLTPVEPRGKSRTMGSVVSFMPRQAAIRRSPRTAETSASIIIFPGVRYERTKGPASGAGELRNDAPRRNDPVPRH
ncbi:hypothetical protein AA2016_4695 [Aminobacter aminovorans]|uniref:Uncharacterized protein n=4 Tax=Aminobacter TaxID=31988 RepID=A0AAC9ASM8_AMIAI|nr:hypothetical protein AA2016_4695 [Aminobacter aminovorans]